MCESEVTDRFQRMNSVSDWWSFRGEFAKQYGYVQFMQHLFA